MPELANFAMPARATADESTCTETYGKFIIEPLEKGFGHTLGNAMRRVLLSSLDGVAITYIKVDSVPHEFASLPHVIEDVTDIVLNFKKVLFECSGDLPRKLELRVKKSGDITAGDIQTDGVTRIVNPDQHLCTLDKERELGIELEIARGRGYRPADENKTADQAIGVIPIDSLFSPVKRVGYHIGECRVGQRTDYDRLEVEVWTDGRINPKEAVKQAGQILAKHIGIFTGLDGEDEDASCLISTPEDEELLAKLLRAVTELELSVRAQNCLNNANIKYIGELVQRSEGEMMKYRNFGQKSLNELKEKLAAMGLHLGYDLKEEVRIAFEKQLEKLRSGA